MDRIEELINKLAKETKIKHAQIYLTLHDIEYVLKVILEELKK